METLIKTREVAVGPDFKEIIYKKIAKIERRYPKAKKLEVEVYQENNPSINKPVAVDLTLHVKNNLLRAESHGNTLIGALDKAVKRINRQLEKYKSKIYHSKIRRR